MAEEGEAEDRTEAASPRRLQQARESGDVPLSKELASLAGLGAATLVFAMAVPAAAHGLTLRLAALMANAGGWRIEQGGAAALLTLGTPVMLLVAPIILAVMVAGSAAVLLQSGFAMRSAALMPDFSRLDPRHGLKRIIGLDNLVEAGKSLAKIAILGTILWRSGKGALPLLGQAMLWQPAMLVDQLTRQVVHLVMMLIAAQALIAGGDYLWVRVRHATTAAHEPGRPQAGAQGDRGQSAHQGPAAPAQAPESAQADDGRGAESDRGGDQPDALRDRARL